MRRLVFYTHISLDGFFSGPNGELDNFGPPADEVHQHANDHLRDYRRNAFRARHVRRDVLLGRRDTSDQDMPKVERGFAEIYQSNPRYVMSRSQRQLDEKSTLVTATWLRA